MTSAFSPGHITCFFQPVSSLDPLSAGSVGAGIRIDSGTTVTVKPASGKPVTEIDGVTVEGRIVRRVVETLDAGNQYDITVEHNLPVGQGFGMSAADAVAAAFCVCHITGKDISVGFRAAHIADLLEGGGRGDVAGIMCKCRQPVRTVAGLPPFGKVRDSFVPIEKITLFTLGSPIDTKSILSDRDRVSKIRKAGAKAAEDYLKNISLKSLFDISNKFSEAAGLRTDEINDAIKILKDKRQMAAMCMLGNSMFTTAPEEAVRELIGDVWMTSCKATNEEARITRIT